MMTEEKFGKELLRLKIIWFAMLASLAIYLFVGLEIANKLQVSMDRGTFVTLKTVLYLFTFVIIAITRYIKKFILSGKGGYGQTAQNLKPLTFQKYTTTMIVSWALVEGIGIFGLVLYLLGKNPADLYLLIMISAAAMLWCRPRKDEVSRLFQKGREASNSFSHD